jgi:hypothetical protein
MLTPDGALPEMHEYFVVLRNGSLGLPIKDQMQHVSWMYRIGVPIISP